MLIQQLVLFKKGDVNIAQQEVLTGLRKGNPFDFRKLFVDFDKTKEQLHASDLISKLKNMNSEDWKFIRNLISSFSYSKEGKV